MLKQRIITALLLVPLVLGALFFLPLKFFALLAALVFLLASREWSAFVSAQPQQWLPLVFCLLLGASLFWLPVDQLWTPHLHPLVMKIVRSHRARRMEEEDLAQMIYTKVFTRLEQYEGKVPFTHWVSRVAVNTCLSAIKAEAAAKIAAATPK